MRLERHVRKRMSVRSVRIRRRLKTDARKIKLINIVISVNFLVLCNVENPAFLCYISWLFRFIWSVDYCTRPAIILCSKFLVTRSEVPIHTSRMRKTLTPSALQSGTLCIALKVIPRM